MAEIQKVIEGLEYCTGPMAKCGYCPYHSGDEMPNSLDDCGILKDAIELLKEQKKNAMTNADIIRNMSDKGLAMFIRMVYLAGRDGDGFAMFDYNLEEWLKKETLDAKVFEFA